MEVAAREKKDEEEMMAGHSAHRYFRPLKMSWPIQMQLGLSGCMVDS
jgi:hypothetical protein